MGGTTTESALGSGTNSKIDEDEKAEPKEKCPHHLVLPEYHHYLRFLGTTMVGNFNVPRSMNSPRRFGVRGDSLQESKNNLQIVPFSSKIQHPFVSYLKFYHHVWKCENRIYLGIKGQTVIKFTNKLGTCNREQKLEQTILSGNIKVFCFVRGIFLVCT